MVDCRPEIYGEAAAAQGVWLVVITGGWEEIGYMCGGDFTVLWVSEFLKNCEIGV